MTDIAWRWRWAEVDSELLVSQAVADILDSHRQGLFGVERGGQLFVNPVNPKGLLLALATLPHRADRSGWCWMRSGAVRRSKLLTNKGYVWWAIGIRIPNLFR